MNTVTTIVPLFDIRVSVKEKLIVFVDRFLNKYVLTFIEKDTPDEKGRYLWSMVSLTKNNQRVRFLESVETSLGELKYRQNIP